MPDSAKAFAAETYDYADVRAVADGLDLSEPVAVTLVRRGYRTPDQARAFLAADESHPASAFDSMEEIVSVIETALQAGARITVHGDFDVDGVCATTVMVSTLRELGAECDWLIPDRIGDGYGLSAKNVEKLAERGTALLLTVDCGITAVEEVQLAQELGMEVIVTDHHQAADQLPNCLLLHPELSNYPFPSLCGTAVAWKLASALRAAHTTDLDLVALATVADVVPLIGENRSLVRRGLAEMRRGRRVEDQEAPALGEAGRRRAQRRPHEPVSGAVGQRRFAVGAHHPAAADDLGVLHRRSSVLVNRRAPA